MLSSRPPVIKKERRFFDVQVPAVRLFAIGATDIAQTLATAAGLAGFEVTIVDPRSAFATPERFPQTLIAAEWPETARPCARNAFILARSAP
ncbi:MAG: XdhC family protein [Methylocella sp.]